MEFCFVPEKKCINDKNYKEYSIHSQSTVSIQIPELKLS